MFFEKLGVVKLTDFGFSNKFSPGQKLETFCGSLAYSAPEILLGDSYDAPAVGKLNAFWIAKENLISTYNDFLNKAIFKQITNLTKFLTGITKFAQLN